MSIQEKLINEIVRDEILTRITSGLEEKVTNQGGFLLPYDRFLINLQSPTCQEEGKGLMVRIFDGKLCHRHLLWHLLFRGITTLEWFILYLKFESLPIREDAMLKRACLTLLISSSSKSRKTLDHWSSRTKPIHKQLASRVPLRDSEFFGKYNTLLDFVISKLQIPKKGMSISELYKTSEITIPRINPAPERWRGIGYKDKGSMSSEERMDLPEDVTQLLPEVLDRSKILSFLQFFEKNFSL
jgi:hypothetical protein